MNNRFFMTFIIALLIIVIAVAIIIGILFHINGTNSSTSTATPLSSGAAVTVHNDTSNAVQVQDCTGALSACASSNTGTTRLAAGDSGTEHGATGLRILNLQGGVVGCISLSGVSDGSTVNVSSARACSG